MEGVATILLAGASQCDEELCNDRSNPLLAIILLEHAYGCFQLSAEWLFRQHLSV